MNKIKLGIVLFTTISFLIVSSFTINFLAEPPIVEDITVCEGESTLITPTSPVPEEMQIACETFESSVGDLGFVASDDFFISEDKYFTITDGTNISLETGGMYSFQDGTNNFWAAEDADDEGEEGGDVEQSITFNSVAIENFTDVKFCFEIAAGNENAQNINPGYDAGDYVFVEYSIDGGGFQEALCFRSALGDDNFNDPLHADLDCDGDGSDGPMLTNAASSFDFIVPSADTDGGMNIVFRILVQMTLSSEEVAIDNIKIKATPSAVITYNFYDADPTLDTTTLVLLAGEVSDYDPGTTVETSPDTVWVTAFDQIMESVAVPVIINVNSNTNAGEDLSVCGIASVSLSAIGDTTLTPSWTGGAGTFSDPNEFVTQYTPDESEIGTDVTLTFNLEGALCGESDDLILTVNEQISAEFTYSDTTVCPSDEILFPIHLEGGIDGIYEVIAGGDGLDLDSITGAIDLSNSETGVYTIQNSIPTTTVVTGSDLMLSGLVDGGLTGGLPKAIEFYVVNDIADLSLYGFGSANNGGGSDGEEFTFPAGPVTAGTYLYLTSQASSFEAFFGFAPDYISGSAAVNGDDAVELFFEGNVIDVFGDIDLIGDFEPWDYTDGWAYRNMDETNNSGTFDFTTWYYSGRDELDGETDNATAANPFPIGTFTISASNDCPIEPETVVFTITDLINTDAGLDQFVCDAAIVNLEVIGDETATPEWTGGAGTFSDPNGFTTTYTVDESEIGTQIILTVTLPGSVCNETDEVVIYSIEQLSAEFSYAVDTICPGDGLLLPNHNEGGFDGVYEVIAGGNGLILDEATGEINLMGSENGTYTIQNTVTSCGNLLISGVIDGDITGGLPKAMEFYAVNDISNLSLYGVGSANNGGGTDGIEFEFPAMSVAAGTYLYLASEEVMFTSFFGFAPDFIDNVGPFAASINGDDAIELFCNGEVIDVYGDIDVIGDGEPWDYTDGWAYRNINDSLNFGEFDPTTWSYSGRDGLEDETTNATAAIPMPIGTFETIYDGVCPPTTATTDFTISDFGGPMIMCPGDLTVNLQPGECGEFVNLVDATALDNCTPDLVFEQIAGPMTGEFLNKEDSPYTVMFEGTTALGEVIECSYMIFIEEYAPQSTALVCQGSINVSLDQNCEVLVTGDMLLEGNIYGCYDDFNISAVYNGSSVGTSIENDYGTGNSLILDNSILNEPIEVSIMDAETGNLCWGYVIVEDKLGPSIVCMDTLIVDCTADVSPIEPEVLDNCGVDYFVMDEDIYEGECNDPYYKEIVRTWYAFDAAGNRSEGCTEVIRIQRDEFSELVFPLNYDDLAGNNPSLNCDGENSEFALDEEGNPSSIGNGDLIGTGVPMLGTGCSNLIIYYNDKVVEICGNSYKVIRDWTVIDWCSGGTAEHTQIIKVTDKIAPNFNTPDDVTVGVNVHCKGSFQLPLIPAIDNCGDATVNFTTTDGIIDNNYFTVDSPELGTAYTINVNGVDACDNVNTQTFTVTFVDLTPPVANAETSLTVTLSVDGTAKLFANSFDDGSYDACGEVEFAVARTFSTCDAIDYDLPAGDDNFQFNDIVHFCCEDTSEPQMVNFRVCDDASDDDVFGNAGDNCNTVMVEVEVQNKLKPIIICPAPTTINCLDAIGLDLSNNALMDATFGAVSVQNGCGGQLIQNAILSEECGVGIIIRTFIAVANGQSAACSQIITVNPNPENILTCDRIDFKTLNNNVYDWCKVNDNINDNDDNLPSIEIDCNEGLIIPELDIDITGLCSAVGETVTVDTFNFAGGACKKYLIHYEVIDQCVFNEDYIDPITGQNNPYHSNNGYFEMYLEVDAFDNEGPEFDPSNETIVAENCDDASVNISVTGSDACTAAEFISYQYRIDFNSDDSIDYPNSGWADGNAITSGQNGLGNLPIGTHTVLWYLIDGCGNASNGIQLITVEENDKEPTPYCKTGLVASISAMGMVSVNASDLNAGSFDNCTPQEDLIYSFSSDTNDTERMYTCDDRGYQFIQVYVTDEHGNQDFCSTSFLVQDNLGFCEDMLVNGLVTSNNGYKNENATVVLQDIETTMSTILTDEEGMYELLSNNFSNEATLHVQDNNELLRGVTTLDILTIQKHILGISALPSNAQWIAGDVNNDGQINGIDIIQLRKALLGYQDYFSNNNSWVVYPSMYDIESLDNPFDYDMYMNINEATSYDFNSIKVGDVNISHSDLTSSIEADNRSKTTIEYSVELLEDNTSKISFYGIDNLVGLDFAFDSNVNSVLSESVNVEGLYNNVGYFRFIWTDLAYTNNDNSVFSVIVDSDVSSLLDNRNHLSSAFIGRGLNTEVNDVEFILRESSNELSEVSIYPNPFSDKTQIDVSSIDFTDVRVEIYDANSKMILDRNYSNQAIIEINDRQLTNSGMYFVKISNGVEVVNKKILKIE